MKGGKNMSDSPVPEVPNANPSPSVSQPEVEVKSAPVKKQYQMIVDGQTESVELGDEDIIKAYQKGKSADKRFQEAAQLKKQMESFIEASKSNPEELLAQLGVNVDEFILSKLQKEIEQSMKVEEDAKKTPEQRRIEELERKLSERESLEEQRVRQLREAEEKRIEDEVHAKLDNDLTNFLEKQGFGKEKPTPRLIARIVEQMQAEFIASQKMITPDEAFNRLQSSYIEDFKEALLNIPEDILFGKLLNDDILAKIKSYEQKRLKGKSVPGLSGGPSANKQNVPQEAIPEYMLQFFKKPI